MEERAATDGSRVHLEIPLDGDPTWSASGPGWSERIDWIELHVDTYDAGFDLNIDHIGLY